MVYAEPPPDLALETRARRRARTNPEQQAILVQYYESVTRKPTMEVCTRVLAPQTGIDGQSVYYWFQNRRSKMQRERQQQERRGRSLSPRAHTEGVVTPSSSQTYVTGTSTGVCSAPTHQPTRLPPVSTLMPMSGSAFTPTTPGAGAAASNAARAYRPTYSDTATPTYVTSPGTAKASPIAFYFHHPSYGIESFMLQMIQLREQRHQEQQQQQQQQKQQQQQQKQQQQQNL